MSKVEGVRMSDDEGDSMCASEGEKKKRHSLMVLMKRLSSCRAFELKLFSMRFEALTSMTRSLPPHPTNTTEVVCVCV